MTSPALFRQDLRRDYPLIKCGKGPYLFDSNDRKLLDATSGGVMVANIGHGVLEVIEAMAEQGRRFSFAFSGLVDNAPEIELAEIVAAMAPAGLTSVFFTSTGTEATETAVKFARLYHLEAGKAGKYKVIGRELSYHGNSFSTMSFGGRSPGSEDFAPYLYESRAIPPAYCYRCPLGLTYPECNIACADALEAAILREGPDTVSCFIAEPIVGRQGGAYLPPSAYFARIRSICDKYDVLWIADEVVTGFGRTGAAFAVEHSGVTPDLLAMGKGIAGGYAPLAGVLINDRIRSAVAAGKGKAPFGYTYAGNPVSCAAGLAVQAFMAKHGLLAAAPQLGSALMDELQTLTNHPLVGDVRGQGLLLGIEIVAEKASRAAFHPELRIADRLARMLYERGVWILTSQGAGAAGAYLLVAPPLVATKTDFSFLADAIGDALDEIRQQFGGTPPLAASDDARPKSLSPGPLLE